MSAEQVANLSVEDNYEDDAFFREKEVDAPAPADSSSSSSSSSAAAAADADGDADGAGDGGAPMKKMSPDLFEQEDQGQQATFMAVKPWIGAIVAPSNPPALDTNPPDVGLAIEWVYGYRAFDSRSNVAINDKGEVVYPTAGLVVLYDPKTHQQRHFMGHNDDVRCLARHPTRHNIFASGQNATIVNKKSSAPYICVWDSNNLDDIYRLAVSETERAIRSVGFSADGKYLASVSNDNNHTVRIWDWEEEVCVAKAKGDTSPIVQVMWSHTSAHEFVTIGQRHALFWTFDPATKELTNKRILLENKFPLQTWYSVNYSEKGYALMSGQDGSILVCQGNKAIKSFAVTHNGAPTRVLSLERYNLGSVSGIIAGTAANTVQIFDSKITLLKTLQFDFKATAVHVTGNDLIVGTFGSEVWLVKDFMNVPDKTKAGVGVAHFTLVTAGSFDGELWAVDAPEAAAALTGDDAKAQHAPHVAYTAGEDNQIMAWDLTNHKLLRKGILQEKKGQFPKVAKAASTSLFPPNQCGRAVVVSPDGKHVAVGMNSGELNIYDSQTFKLLHTIDLNATGKRNVTNQSGNWIEVAAYSPSGKTLAVGTHGSVIVLCDVAQHYAVKSIIKSHNSFITAIDWSKDCQYIQSTCGAYELLFHQVDENDPKRTATQVTRVSSIKDVQYASQTCKFGWTVQGVFGREQDGSDVNTVHANPSRTLLLSGDDNGHVNLFRYPVAQDGAHFWHAGHSSHVPTVRWVNEHTALSVGGHDVTLIQWKVGPINPKIHRAKRNDD